MKYLLILILTLISTASAAYSLSVEYGLSVDHLDYEGWMNEDNDFIAVEYVKGKHGVNSSSFVNTFGRQTFTLGGSYSLYSNSFFDFGVLYGVVKGYNKGEIDTVIDKDFGVYFAPRVTVKYKIYKNISAKVSSQLFGSAVVTSAGLEIKF